MTERGGDARRSNACAAMSDADFEELGRIARFEVGSGTFLTAMTSRLGAVAAEALPGWVSKALETALGPVLLQTGRLVAGSHDGGGDGWRDRAASFAKGEWFHRGAVVVSGAVGGSFGLATAVCEVAVSTALIMRSIQDVAIGYGADLRDPVVIAECVAVLGKGGPMPEDDALDESYFAMRAGLKRAVSAELLTEALASEPVKKALASKAVEQILQSEVFRKIVQRFGVTSRAVLVEKAVPVVGGVLGAFVNYQFVSYYQNMAHVVFRLKAIEGRYETGQVDSCYRRVLASIGR